MQKISPEIPCRYREILKNEMILLSYVNDHVYSKSKSVLTS